MILVDANFLLYAYDPLAQRRSGPAVVGERPPAYRARPRRHAR